ncbi:hypothetical protein ACJDU8_17795 [Clostridium sp. WILCCON 0269]|uniref:Uncharacterized protein n=1 Tax=Candidatus Clostridium eludens TaxID=3381663 RepID=A0ABW8SRW1_9CLOT
MDYSRKNINGTSSVDIKNINDNFKYLFMKIYEKVTKTTTSAPTETTQTTPTLAVDEPNQTATYAYFADDPVINLPVL